MKFSESCHRDVDSLQTLWELLFDVADRRLESHSSSEAAILGRNESDFFDRIDEDAATILDQERQRLKPKPKNKTIIISQVKTSDYLLFHCYSIPS